jgi:hypothetical protein
MVVAEIGSSWMKNTSIEDCVNECLWLKVDVSCKIGHMCQLWPCNAIARNFETGERVKYFTLDVKLFYVV